jgi:3-dehydroquinate dehydratase / shikimate dehydrogenase
MSRSNRICVVIRERDEAAVETALRSSRNVAGFCEIRLDYLPSHQITPANLGKWVKLAGTAVIVTLRRTANGGEFGGDEAGQIRVLESILQCGAAYFDLEIETVENHLKGRLDLLRKGQSRWIVSYHNFQETPRDLSQVCHRLLACKPDVVKIATKACTFADNFRLLDLIREARLSRKDLILVAMGELGAYSRILGPGAGSFLTYASTERGRESAPGQFTAEELNKVYRVNEIQAETKIYGVIGYPIGHSLSPYVHNAAFQSYGLNACYLPLAVPDLSDLSARLKYFAGLSITIPHKVSMLRYVDRQDETVHSTGAANTLVIRPDRIDAHNTDVAGVLTALREPIEKGIRQVTLLGTGGAARSAAVVLKHLDCQVSVLARDREKAKAFATEFGFAFSQLSEASKFSGDLLINATAVGMFPRVDEIPIPSEAIRYRYVFDMVYNPLETRLLQAARSRAIAISGLEMFLGQAARQFELWTGQQAPLQLMREVALARLARPGESSLYTPSSMGDCP